MTSALKRVLCYVFATAFVLAGWHLTSIALDTPALPTPLETIVVLGQYAPALKSDFLISAGRIALSMLIGTVLGLPLGLALGMSRRFGQLFSPVLYMLYPVPKIVLFPVLLVLLGLGGAPKIVLITLTVLFQVVLVMRDAAAAVPQSLLLSVRSLGASRLDEWRYVVLPATLPQLFTTLRVSTAIAIAVLFFAESFAGSTGLGYFIMISWSMVNYARMFAGIVALALLGVLFYIAFDLGERFASRWKR